jgi:hypothetical protein
VEQLIGFVEYALFGVVALVAAVRYARVDGYAGESARFPALLALPCFAIAL